MHIIEKARLLTSREDYKSLFIQLITPILIFTAARWLYFAFSKLSENSYFKESISLELIGDYRLILIFLFINTFLLINYRKLNWTKSKLDRTVKVFLFIVSI